MVAIELYQPEMDVRLVAPMVDGLVETQLEYAHQSLLALVTEEGSR